MIEFYKRRKLLLDSKFSFESELLESQMLKLKVELNRFIREDKDSVIVFKSRSQKWLDKEFLGMIEDDKTDNFL